MLNKSHIEKPVHSRQHAITSTSDHTSTATSGQVLKADSNGLPVNSVMAEDSGGITTGTAAAGKDFTLKANLGSELCPAMTQALWTEGAGWTINDIAGTATRIASVSTTLVPTTPIVPSTSKRYKIVFTISGYSAGTMTMAFGG